MNPLEAYKYPSHPWLTNTGIKRKKKGKYYYGRVSSDSGATFYRPGNDDFTSCKKNEYFLIDKNEGLDIDMFHDKKEDILNVVHEYKVKKPYEFFIFSILR